MTRLFKELVSVEEALDLFLPKLSPIGEEVIAVPSSLNRVLREDVTSPIDMPSFDRAAFDGFAVRSEDVLGASPSNPVILRVIGEALAGRPFNAQVGSMEAVRIATGAPVPEGADSVVPLEYANDMGDSVEIVRQVPPGANIDRRGSDVRKGDLVLRGGTIIGPFEILLLTSLNVTEVRVSKRPSVVVVSTGDELVPLGSEITEGKIVESNSHMIASLISELADVMGRIIVGDDLEAMRSSIGELLNQFDVVVTVGGTSVGERDLVPDAVESLGGEIVVRGISVMPGRPTLLAIIDGKPLVGLPGSPVSAAVAAMEILLPVLAKIQGIAGRPAFPMIRAQLTSRVPSRPGTRHFVRVRVWEEDGRFYAEPVRVVGSGIVSSLTRAHGFLIVPEEVEGYERGEEVEVRLFRRWVNFEKGV